MDEEETQNENENESEKEKKCMSDIKMSIKEISKRIQCKIIKLTVSKSYNKNNRKERRGTNQGRIERKTLREQGIEKKNKNMMHMRCLTWNMRRSCKREKKVVSAMDHR